MKAVFLDFGTLGPGDIDAAPLTSILPGIELHADSAAEELGPRLADAQIAIVNKIALNREIFDRAPGLRLVCLAATGTDNVDLVRAREKGIAVANIRDYCAASVTQHVFALILALNQRLREYAKLLEDDAWPRSGNFCLLDYPFHELAGKTFGIVGLGNLGRSVARLAGAFGMHVLAARRPYRPAADKRRTAPEGNIERVSYPELLARSHIISLHCPLNEDTRTLVDEGALALMRPDALLINTARGALVDSSSLLVALRGGVIAGAGIDVLDTEPPVGGHPLLDARLPNLIVTPHIAWAAREARQRAVAEIALNVAAFLKGEKRNRVD